jgi:hypothetical protein
MIMEISHSINIESAADSCSTIDVQWCSYCYVITIVNNIAACEGIRSGISYGDVAIVEI